MRIYNGQTVLEAAKDRIRYLFDEFENVVVNISGGKDSTVIFYLALEIAKEKNRLPLPVMFLDQEIEWQATIDVVKPIMYMPEVKPMWFQIPFVLYNATSATEHWLHCWDPEKKHLWMRDKDPIAIHENVYNEERFAEMYEAIFSVHFKNQRAIHLTGVRGEESPRRMMGLTAQKTYKWITWGRVEDSKQGHYSFHPLYDWSYLDIWKYIHDNKLPYNRIYDLQYRYGVPVQKMRVSNLHHETAVHALFYLQEAEPETYNKATQRMAGLDMAGKMGEEDFFVKKLPFMFQSWRDYRDHLLRTIVTDKTYQDRFCKYFNGMESRFDTINNKEDMYKTQVQSILTQDWEFVKLLNWERSPNVRAYTRWKNKGELPYKIEHAVLIPGYGRSS